MGGVAKLVTWLPCLFSLGVVKMIWIQRTICVLVSVTLILISFYFQSNIPTVGATGEAISIGGKFYPTALVLWSMWLITVAVAGIFLIYAVRPK